MEQSDGAINGNGNSDGGAAGAPVDGGANGGALAPKARSFQTVGATFDLFKVGAFFSDQLFDFSAKEMRFLREFGPDTSIEEAAKKANVPVDYAKHILRRKDVREFLQDKFQQIAIQHGWTVERWFVEGDRVWRGQKAVTREQLDIWKEFGARILPKAKGPSAGDGGEKPQITINIGAVDEAHRRQQAINAEIVDAGAA